MQTNFDSAQNSHIFARGFLENQHTLLVARRMNELCAENANLVPVVLALMLYPAIKCVLQEAPAVNDIFAMFKDDHIEFLTSVAAAVEKTQKLNITTIDEIRRENVCLGADLVKKIDTIAEKLRKFPGYGPRYSEVLDVVLNRPGDKPASRYAVNHYLGPMVQCVAQLMEGDQELLNQLVEKVNIAEEYPVWDTCNAMLQIIQAHAQVKWYGNFDTDEQRSVVRGKYVGAMQNVFEAVGEFPGTKEMCGAVLQTIIELKTQGYSDENLAAQLNVSSYTYSTVKKTALTVFSGLFFANYAAFLWLLRMA